MDRRTVDEGQQSVEAGRRAALIDRYASIPSPTAEDDQHFACELGLSIDAMQRLVTIWLRHRDPALLGARIRRSPHVPDRSRIMARSIDMTGVSMTRADFVLRRIRIIQEYLRARESNIADEQAAAKKMGVGSAYFRDLVRSWTRHARACDMPGACRRKSTWGRKQPARARRLALLKKVMNQSRAGMKVNEMHRHFDEACKVAGIETISLPRFYSLVRELREADKQG
jgi:hypothetical protein